MLEMLMELLESVSSTNGHEFHVIDLCSLSGYKDRRETFDYLLCKQVALASHHCAFSPKAYMLLVRKEENDKI